MDFILDLKRLYGKNESVESLLSGCSLTYELQESVVDLVLRDELICKYPTSVKYRRRFLKALIAAVEACGEEVHPVILNDYIELINGRSADETYYRIYYPEDGRKRAIVMEQYEAVISNGTTGCHVWPAAVKLVGFLEEKPELFEKKVVLELGAGVGLVGLHCLRDSKPKSYVFTDHHDLVLKQLERNIQLNQDTVELNEQDVVDTSKLINILKLDWMNISDMSIDFPIDVILASDVIFDPEIVPHLVNTIDHLLTRATEYNNSRAQAYISSAIRNQDTYSLFLKQLDKHSLKHKLLEKIEAPLNDKSITSIEIIQIFK